MLTQINHILIVEDDNEEVDLLKKSFAICCSDITCTVLSDGKEVLKYLDTGAPPDLIILDLFLPFIDGIECLKKIRENDRFAEVPILFYSNSAPQNLYKDALIFPKTSYFHKPNSIAEVELFAKTICSGKYLQISYSK